MANLRRMWSTIPKPWSLGWVSAVDSNGRTTWTAEGDHSDAKRFVVRSDEKLAAFLELEAAIRARRGLCLTSR